jgi:hypothetical protein
MTAFIALYRGETVSGAQLVAVTAEPGLVRDFAARMIGDDLKPEEGRREGLRLVESNQEDKQT